jgi:GNAT superfamily N-acetyltransferase
MDIRIRPAVPADVPRLRALLEASVRALHVPDYTPAQIEGALASVYDVDSRLIEDGTYLVAETGMPPEIVGCGGWSRHATLYGGDNFAGRADDLLDPARDAAKIRAFFVDPARARSGIGSLILAACERGADAAGFTRLELGATLPGVPFYERHGYAALDRADTVMPNGETLAVVRMAKRA